MSHAATNWAILQRGLKPATKILLWHLCDRHNKDTKRCDPSQDRLADDCEMSRASINRHLDTLSDRALIRRVPRLCPRTKRQLSTYYELAFDHEISAPDSSPPPASQNETQPMSQIDTRTVSQNGAEPCLKNVDSRVSNCDTNPVREPGREPCAVSTSAHDPAFYENFFVKFFDAYPRLGDKALTERLLIEAIVSGVHPDRIIAGAKAYAREQADNTNQYKALSENWVSRRVWERFDDLPSSARCPETVALTWADKIKQGQRWCAPHVTAAMAHDLIVSGHVTEAQCLEAGIQL